MHCKMHPWYLLWCLLPSDVCSVHGLGAYHDQKRMSGLQSTAAICLAVTAVQTEHTGKPAECLHASAFMAFTVFINFYKLFPSVSAKSSVQATLQFHAVSARTSTVSQLNPVAGGQVWIDSCNICWRSTMYGDMLEAATRMSWCPVSLTAYCAGAQSNNQLVLQLQQTVQERSATTAREIQLKVGSLLRCTSWCTLHLRHCLPTSRHVSSTLLQEPCNRMALGIWPLPANIFKIISLNTMSNMPRNQLLHQPLRARYRALGRQA